MAVKDVIVNIGANSKQLQRELLISRSALSKFGLAAGVVGVAAAATIKTISASVKDYAQFEKGFTNVVTLLDESSFKTKSLNEGITDLARGINDLRGTTGRSFDDLNKSLFDLISAGVEAEGALDVLKVSSDLALAGATETGIAVDGLSSAMNAYGFEAEKAQELAEKFFTAQKFGKTTIEELSRDFGKVGATASAMGVSFDEVLASVSAVTLAGVKTNEAYTGLKAVLSNIIKPSAAAAAEAKRLGVEFDSAALRTKGLDGFLNDLKNSANFNAESMEKLFGSTEALNVVLALTGGQANDFKNILTQLNDESERGATFQAALAVKSDTVDEAYKRLEGSASALKATLGEVFAPAVIKSADMLSESIRNLNDKLRSSDTLLEQMLKSLQRLSQNQYNLAANFIGAPNLDDLYGLDFATVDPFQALTDSAMDMANSVKKEFDAINEKEAEIQKIREDRAKAEAEKEAERARVKSEREAARISAKEEREEEARLRKLEREEEQFEEDVELLTQRLSGLNEIENEFSGLRELRELQELRNKAKTADQKEKIDRATALASEKYSRNQMLAATQSLETIFDTTTSIGKAIFLFNKAMAIADTLKTTQQASILAYASQLIPGDPTSIARAEFARNVTLIRGAITAAAIGATAIQGMQDGGIVGGAGVGDKVLKMLEPGEIVVPKPAAPTFSQLFGNFPNGLTQNQQSSAPSDVRVLIGLTDDASQILTAAQYEDSRIGVTR